MHRAGPVLRPFPPRPDLPPPPGPWPRRRRPAWLLPVALLTALTLAGAAIGTVGVVRRAPAEGEHRFLEVLPDGAPYRWNPCQPIHYQVNLDNAPSGALADVQEAVRRVSQATGIRFVYDGATERTADRQVSTAFKSELAGEPPWLPVLIDWVPHEHFDFMVDTNRAAAFGMPRRGEGDLSHTYVSGVVAVDAGEDLPPGFGERLSVGVVLMHELGHVMGLGHVGSGGELMWSPEVEGASRFPDPYQSEWGPGDLEGLGLLGREAGCLPARSN